MKRAIILAHYDRFNQVSDYVVYYLKALRELADELVFVSTSPLPPEETNKVSSIATKVILKENVGYDFGSWQAGLRAIDQSLFDQIVICNDSVFGPLQPLPPIFEKMNATHCDFWGITNSYDMGEHIQSYFVVFNKKVISSTAFSNFWTSIRQQPDKLSIVQKYEIGLTKTLREAGFKHQVLVPYKRIWGLKAFWEKLITELSGRSKQSPTASTASSQPRKRTLKNVLNILDKAARLIVNPTHYCWRQTIEQGSPFIKVDLLRDNQYKVNIIDWENLIKSFGTYPIVLIQLHLSQLSRKLGKLWILF